MRRRSPKISPMTVVVVAIGGGMLMGLLLVGAPIALVFVGVGAVAADELSQRRAAWAGRRELEAQVPALREAVLAYEEARGELPGELGPEPREVWKLDRHAAPWAPDSPLLALDWDPPDEVLGTYHLIVDGEGGFEVVGLVDQDGDANPAVWRATRTDPGRLVTPTWMN